MDKLTTGQIFGNYRIAEIVGEGGFATVYLADDIRPAMSRRVAIKVLGDQFATDPAFRDRFARESRLAANLDHPNIVPIFDAGESDGRLYIAMRFVEGIDLKERLTNGPLPPREAIAVVRQIASALDLAHRTGLIHRDVKPGNVLMAHGQTSQVYLADFGITKETSDGTEFTQTGLFLGTLSYASPEQIDGQPLDGRSDQYALGCLLFESLTGHPPFQGTLQAVIGAHVSKQPPSLSREVPGVPPAMDGVISRALAKDPSARFPTCQALVEAADLALSSGLADQTDETVITPDRRALDPNATVITGADPRSSLPPAAVTAPSADVHSIEPPPKSGSSSGLPTVPEPPSQSGVSPWWLAAAGAVAALAVLIAAFVISTGGDDDTEVRTASSATDDASRPAGNAQAPPTTATVDSSQFTGAARTIQPERVAAPLQTAPGFDACRQTTTYEPQQMFDGNPTTAWRTAGDGTGRNITINLGGETLVTSAGLLNGLAKVDSCDGTDRYFDQRRVTSVVWSFDDGTTVSQTFDPSTKTVQSIDISAVTTRVALQITGTTPAGARDFTPIAEIEIVGVPADTG